MAGSPKLPLRSNSATYDDGGLEAKSERSVRGFFKGPRSAIAVRSGCVKRNSSAVKYGRDLRQHLPNEKSETRLWGTGSTKPLHWSIWILIMLTVILLHARERGCGPIGETYGTRRDPALLSLRDTVRFRRAPTIQFGKEP